MVLKIAHQVVRTSFSRAPWRAAGDPHPFQKKIGSSRIWLQLFVMPCKGEMNRDAVEWCQARRQAGVAPHVCVRVGNGRGMEARQGAIRVCWEIPIPPSSSPPRRRRPCRKRTGAGPHEAPMRDLAKPGPAKGQERFVRGLARGDGSGDCASGEAGMVGRGALRRERCL